MGEGNKVSIIKKTDRKGSMMSYFWDNNKHITVYKIKFAKKDTAEEFVDYFKKITY